MPTDIQPPRAASLVSLPSPSWAYRGRAWLAVLALLGFIALYLGLAGWFLATAAHLLAGSVQGDDGWLAVLAGLCAAFLAAFMLKGLFFIKRGKLEGVLEITAAQQPALFRFLHEIADAAAAPRPHRVFLSPRVNAAVSYDLSLLNLLLPSRKNLEIGLGLVNILTREELRAVLAHEFGHFAQRSMAVGRWVYVAQQVAAHLVARRDRFDDFLARLSRADPRIAWVGWAVSLVVWALRALVDSAFRVVVAIQRALSRQMELNADLVAVQLAGSDALVHSLHRLQAADDCWERATQFIVAEHRAGRTPEDAFAVQARILEHMRRILGDPYYGAVAPVPTENPQAHRVFKAGLAQPARMWLTHPLNHEREANAKRRYIPSDPDQTSAWTLFQDALRLRSQLTASMLDAAGAAPEPWEATLERVDEQFSREFLNPRYRGIYLGRSPVRYTVDAGDLFDAHASADRAAYEALYPSSLAGDMEQLRSLERELAQLRGLQDGTLKTHGQAPGQGGDELARSAVPALLAARQCELKEVHKRLRAHDRACRGWHAAAARIAGQGWPQYMAQLLRMLHYADHAQADLLDAYAWFRSVLSVHSATRRVGKAARRRILSAADRLYATLTWIYDEREAVRTGRTLTGRMGIGDWPGALGKLELVPPSAQNLGNWMDALDAWVRRTADLLGLLRNRALEELLIRERQLAAHVLEGQAIGAAGDPPRTPESYLTLLPGQERARQTRLGWRARFLVADGILPSLARLAASCGILAMVLGLGFLMDRATVIIYNGLARDVDVRIGDAATLHVGPHAAASTRVPARHAYEIVTTAGEQPVERFQVDIDAPSSRQVYNVAAASPLVEWSVPYGHVQPPPPSELGAPRWSVTRADVLFGEPPASVSAHGPTLRRVLHGVGDGDPQDMLARVSTQAEGAAMIRAHATWDGTSDRHIVQWLSLASALPDFQLLLARRLREAPHDVLLRRLEIDMAPEARKQAVCARQRAQADAAPNDAVARYLAIRCLPDGAAQDQAYLDAYRRWPSEPWLANAAGYVEACNAHWDKAQAMLEQAARALPQLAPLVSVDLARIARLRGQAISPALKSLFSDSDALQRLAALESGAKLPDGPIQAYPALARGDLDRALGLAAKGDDAFHKHMLRLAAASDGASPALVQAALALDAEAGLNAATIWASIALAIREKRDYEALLDRAAVLSPDHFPAMRGLVETLARGKGDPEQWLGGLPPELRGQAFAIGVIVLGANAPEGWRRGAISLLFGSERPYFQSDL